MKRNLKTGNRDKGLPTFDFRIKRVGRYCLSRRGGSGRFPVVEIEQASKPLGAEDFFAGVFEAFVRERNDVSKPLMVSFSLMMWANDSVSALDLREFVDGV